MFVEVVFFCCNTLILNALYVCWLNETLQNKCNSCYKNFVLLCFFDNIAR